MRCSRCGCYQPNQSCYVCREEEQPAPETPDHETGHLLQEAMKPETARLCSAFALVAFVVTGIALYAFGVRDFEAYLAIILLAILAGFIGATQDD